MQPFDFQICGVWAAHWIGNDLNLVFAKVPINIRVS